MALDNCADLTTVRTVVSAWVRESDLVNNWQETEQTTETELPCGSRSAVLDDSKEGELARS